MIVLHTSDPTLKAKASQPDSTRVERETTAELLAPKWLLLWKNMSLQPRHYRWLFMLDHVVVYVMVPFGLLANHSRDIELTPDAIVGVCWRMKKKPVPIPWAAFRVGLSERDWA